MMAGMTELHQLEYLVHVSGFFMNMVVMMAIQLLLVQAGDILLLPAHPFYYQIIYSLLYIVYQQRALQQLSSLSMVVTVVQFKFICPQVATLEILMT